MTKYILASAAILAAGVLVAGCKASQAKPKPTSNEEKSHACEADHTTHDHGEEVPLGVFDIGGMSIQAAQGHGKVKAGAESHLIVKLPHNDKGATTVRAWIGAEDRTLSMVGKGEYAAGHDDYDIHTTAPKPLPAGAKWWVEIEMPDGSKAVGSFPFLGE